MVRDCVLLRPTYLYFLEITYEVAEHFGNDFSVPVGSKVERGVARSVAYIGHIESPFCFYQVLLQLVTF